MGMVAAKAHQKGSTKSANRPSTVKTIQNIFFCIEGIVRCWAAGAVANCRASLDWTAEGGCPHIKPIGPPRRPSLREPIILIAFGGA